MYVELEWQRGVTQFPHSLYRVEPGRRANFENLFAELSGLRDDIDVAGARRLSECIKALLSSN